MAPAHRVVAIDGPAASGKSTTAKRVALALGFVHLDTGAMYRAMTVKVLEAGVAVDDAAAMRRLVDSTVIRLANDHGTLAVFLDDNDVSEAIRRPDVTKSVSAVSSLKIVREAMVREQRRIAEEADIVAEGRDIGTVVFPHADVKIFMVADIEARARRRQQDFAAQGISVELPVLVEEIRARDVVDSTRTESPLREAPDAIRIDTSGLTIDGQVEEVVNIARRKLGLKTAGV